MKDESSLTVDHLMGRFHGRGTWRDSAGNTGGYDAFVEARATDNGIEISQRHVPDDGASTELTFRLDSVAPFIYRVEAAGQDGGFGFAMNDLMRFCFGNHIGSTTEIGYQARSVDTLVAYGFTDRNSYGNYVMWHEDLERVPDSG